MCNAIRSLMLPVRFTISHLAYTVLGSPDQRYSIASSGVLPTRRWSPCACFLRVAVGITRRAEASAVPSSGLEIFRSKQERVEGNASDSRAGVGKFPADCGKIRRYLLSGEV